MIRDNQYGKSPVLEESGLAESNTTRDRQACRRKGFVMKRLLNILGGVLVVLTVTIIAVVALLYLRNGHVGTDTDFERSVFLESRPAPLGEAITLKIITFNIQDMFIVGKDRQVRMRHIARALADLDPDIVGFQESFIDKDRQILIRALESTRLRHHHCYPSGVGGSGLLISSAWPIREVFFHRYSVSGPPHRVWEGDYWAGKGVALARVETPAGMLDFYNTHAQAGYGGSNYVEVRKQQMAELAAFMNGSRAGAAPAFLVGDMNCSPGEEDCEIVVREAGLRRLMKKDSGVDQIFSGSAASYNFEVLDTVEIADIVSEGGRTFGLSDHSGFMSTIRVTPAGNAPEQVVSQERVPVAPLNV